MAVLDVPADTSFHKQILLVNRVMLGGAVKKQVDHLTINVLNRREQMNSQV